MLVTKHACASKPRANGLYHYSSNWSVKDCNLSAEDAAGISRDLDTYVDASADLMKTVQQMVVAKKFDQLDCLSDHYRTSKEKFSGGVWKLHTFYLALSEAVLDRQHPTEQDWLDHISMLESWISDRPKSLTARVGLASTYISYAWAARGAGKSDSVTDSGWRLFEERLGRASDLLNDSSSVAKDAEWCFVMLQDCVQSEGAAAGKFQTYTSVSETGSVEDMKVYWYGQAAICIYSKLKAAKDTHSILFAKPPHGSYWVRLDLDAKSF